MTDAERYAISVQKVTVDGEELWRATVRELPDLAEFAETREDALDLAADAIESLRATAEEEGRAFPEPIEDDEEFSGRVTLRMSKSMHRAVAQRADLEGVSLNSYLVECIALRSAPGAQNQAAEGWYAAISATGSRYDVVVIDQTVNAYGNTLSSCAAPSSAWSCKALRLLENEPDRAAPWSGIVGTGIDFNLQLPSTKFALWSPAERRHRP